jgi:hypothetical protein
MSWFSCFQGRNPTQWRTATSYTCPKWGVVLCGVGLVGVGVWGGAAYCNDNIFLKHVHRVGPGWAAPPPTSKSGPPWCFTYLWWTPIAISNLKNRFSLLAAAVNCGENIGICYVVNKIIFPSKFNVQFFGKPLLWSEFFFGGGAGRGRVTPVAMFISAALQHSKVFVRLRTSMTFSLLSEWFLMYTFGSCCLGPYPWIVKVNKTENPSSPYPRALY